MPSDRHEAIRTLLPWFVTGQLDAADGERVESHLRVCEACRGEVIKERQLSSEVAKLSIDVEQGWAAMRERVAQDRPGVAKPWLRGSALFGSRGWPIKPAWMTLAVAAQLAVLLATAGLISSNWRTNDYHALSSGRASPVGNVVVVFAPETNERDLRRLLKVNHARLVDGPTAADAYVLNVPAGERASILSRLRHQSAIVLAEPVDNAKLEP